MIALALIPFALALWRPVVGLGLVAAALPVYLIRFTVFGIPTTLLELAIYALVLGTAIHLAVQGQLRLRLNQAWERLAPYRWPLLAILLTASLATRFSVDLRASLGAFKAWYLDAALVLLLVVLWRYSVRPWLAGGLALGSSVLSAFGLWEFATARAALVDGRLNSVYESANYHALLTVPIIVLLIGLAIQWRAWRPWFGLAIALNLLALFLTFSYGGYLGLAAGLIALVLGLSSRRSKRLLAVAWLVVVVVFFASQPGTEKFQRLDDLTSRSSASVRLQIWRTTARMITEHPWLGVGPGAYELVYRQTVPRVVFPPLEWLVALPHNFVLAVLSQTGSLGLTAVLWLLIAFFRQCRRRGDPLGLTLTAVMVSLLVHGLVDTPYFKNDLAVLFVLIVGLSHTSRREGVVDQLPNA